MSPLAFFTDPILRAPTIGSMLMCMASALVGVLVFLRKQTLVAEALSHATYPGVMGAVVLVGWLGFEKALAPTILVGAFVASLLAIAVIHWLEQQQRVSSDAALCFVLATFFGVGVTAASGIQFSYSRLYTFSQSYLFGQAATMTDKHIILYGILCLVIVVLLLLFYKEIQILTFASRYAKTLGIPIDRFYPFLFAFLVLAVVIGIRSVGIVLLSGMFVAPAVTARQWTNHFGTLLFLAALFGLLSGWGGNVLSVSLSARWNISLPTGPLILLFAAGICGISLLIAPDRGILPRLYRKTLFRHRSLCENILKTLWRLDPDGEITFTTLQEYQSISSLYLHLLLFHLIYQGWVLRTSPHHYRLSTDGKGRAAKIVRLHRLWELYLAHYLGVGGERVHLHAEEMEHVLTPAVEEELTRLFHNPTQDPHQQPIPPREDLSLHGDPS